jgi:hypothetical protein
LTALEALDCTHFALRTTLVAGRAFHNGNIVANVAAGTSRRLRLTVVQCVLRRFLNLPNSGLPDLQGISRCRVRDHDILLYGLIARHKA